MINVKDGASIKTGQTIANSMIATIGDNLAICLYTSANVHAIVDVSGFATTDSNYMPLNPARLLDTRAGMKTIDGLEQAGGAIGGQHSREMPVDEAHVGPVPIAGEAQHAQPHLGGQWRLFVDAGLGRRRFFRFQFS